jgi:hypothetical protein
LLRDNNIALDRLRNDIGGLNLNVTGEDIAKARTALGTTAFDTSQAHFVREIQRLREGLESQGLTMADLERIGKELGISIVDRNGNFSFAAVNQLMQAMRTVSPGRVGQSFSEQLDFFRTGQRLDGAEGTLGGLSGLLDFLRNVGGVRALDGIDLSDPAAARQALRNLITQLNNGQGVEGLGRLTGSQFLDILTQIIGGLDELGSGGDDAGDDDSAGGDDAEEAGGGLVPITGEGGVTFTLKNIHDVIAAMDTNVTAVLTEHTGFHRRIADATEGSFMELRTMNTKMDTLIIVTEGQFQRIDRDLASVRLAAAASAGVGPSF